MGAALFCKLKKISVDLSVVEKLLNLKKFDLKLILANGKKWPEPKNISDVKRFEFQNRLKKKNELKLIFPSSQL